MTEPATRELIKFLESQMDRASGETLNMMHNISVGIMDRFAFDYGSSIEMAPLRQRIRIHPDTWEERTTHEIRNESAWNDLIGTVATEW